MKENNVIPFKDFKVGVKYIDRNGRIRTCVFTNKQTAVFEDDKENSLILKPDSFNTFTVYNNEQPFKEFKKFVVLYSSGVLGIVYLRNKNEYKFEYQVLEIEEAEELGLKL